VSHDWKVTLDKTGFSETMPVLHSWADDAAGRYYSGTATYVRMVDIPANVAHADGAMLDFGVGNAGGACEVEPAGHADLV
jgi:hypothetical protein